METVGVPSPTSSSLDELGRPVVAADIKSAINSAFKGVRGRGALVMIAGVDGSVSGHLAAKLGENWKVAGGVGVEMGFKRPHGWVAIEGVW
jgi:hypothetical protein